MPEEIIEPSPDGAELAVLKQAHQEVLTKRQKDKARIAELQSTVTGLQSKLSEATDTIREVMIGVPVKAMAESMSTAPELFLEQFSKHYNVQIVNGALTLQTIDGKPVLSAGKPVPFERQALTELLTADDSNHAKTFRAITIASRASGAASTSTTLRGKTDSAATKRPVRFGLR